MITAGRVIYGLVLLLVIMQLLDIRRSLLSHKPIMPIGLSILVLMIPLLIIHMALGTSPLHLIWVVPFCMVFGTILSGWLSYLGFILNLLAMTAILGGVTERNSSEQHCGEPPIRDNRIIKQECSGSNRACGKKRRKRITTASKGRSKSLGG